MKIKKTLTKNELKLENRKIIKSIFELTGKLLDLSYDMGYQAGNDSRDEEVAFLRQEAYGESPSNQPI